MRPQAAINCQCVKLAIGVGAKSTSGRSMRRRGITATGLAGLAKVGRVAPGRGAATQPPRVAEGFTFAVTDARMADSKKRTCIATGPQPEKGNSSVESAPKSKKIKCSLRKSDFENAARQLVQRMLDCENSEAELDFEPDPVVVRKGLTMSEVHQFYQRHDGCERLRCKFTPGADYNPDDDPYPNADPDEIVGDLVATEFPSHVHEHTAGNFLDQLSDALRNAGCIDLQRAASIRCRVGRISKEPDGSLTPRGLRVGGTVKSATSDDLPFPNLILEVAFKNESMGKLIQELKTWMSTCTSVQVAIGIKIFERQANGTRRMLILVFRRGSRAPEQQVEFGTDIGSAAGRVVSIRLADLYHGVALPAGAAVDASFDVDMEALQAVILENLPASAPHQLSLANQWKVSRVL